jgi:hypothetical protein
VLDVKRRNWLSPIIQSSHPPIIPRPAPPHRLDLFIFTHTPTIHRAPPPSIPPPSSSSPLRGNEKPQNKQGHGLSAPVTHSYPCCTRPANLHFVAVHVEAVARLLLTSRHRKHPVSTDHGYTELAHILCSNIRGNTRARERGEKERGERERERRERENTTHTGEHGRRVWEESEGGERRGEKERVRAVEFHRHGTLLAVDGSDLLALLALCEPAKFLVPLLLEICVALGCPQLHEREGAKASASKAPGHRTRETTSRSITRKAHRR